MINQWQLFENYAKTNLYKDYPGGFFTYFRSDRAGNEEYFVLQSKGKEDIRFVYRVWLQNQDINKYYATLPSFCFDKKLHTPTIVHSEMKLTVDSYEEYKSLVRRVRIWPLFHENKIVLDGNSNTIKFRSGNMYSIAIHWNDVIPASFENVDLIMKYIDRLKEGLNIDGIVF